MAGGNVLYYGDNLYILKQHIPSESVDLIYLDPPFNSHASYNVLFKAPSGSQSAAQIEAFEDTWHWNEPAERAFDEVVTGPHSDAAIMLRAMRSALGDNDMMAYLAMMAVRLIALRRALKPDGALYLHCDTTASHYLKVLLDAVFGPKRLKMKSFGNEPHRTMTLKSSIRMSLTTFCSTLEATNEFSIANLSATAKNTFLRSTATRMQVAGYIASPICVAQAHGLT